MIISCKLVKRFFLSPKLQFPALKAKKNYNFVCFFKNTRNPKTEKAKSLFIMT